MYTYVKHAVDRATELTESGGINEERRYEVHRVRASELSGELRRPSLRNRTLTEEAALARERGGKDATVVFELVGMVRVRRDERA